MIRRIAIGATLAVALAFSVTAPAYAGLVLGVDFANGSPAGTDVTYHQRTAGYSFNLSQPYEITSLGLWSRFPDVGFQDPHTVALWNSGGSLLESVGFSSGKPGQYVPSSFGGWYFIDLATPLTLAPGDYVLGALYDIGNDDKAWYGMATSDYTSAPGVTFGQSLHNASGDGFGFPNIVGSAGVGYFGPNFQGAAVPEPSSLALMAAAMGGFGLFRRARNKRLAQSGDGSNATSN